MLIRYYITRFGLDGEIDYNALCLFETSIPQSWFDSIEHLVVHLAEEIRLTRPAYWPWMYPIERLLGKLKQRLVIYKARVEGSIAE